MFFARFLSGAVLLCIINISGKFKFVNENFKIKFFQYFFYDLVISAKRMSLEEDLTVLIDHEKYQEMFKPRRTQRQAYFSNGTEQYDFPVQEQYQDEYKGHADDATRLDVGCIRGTLCIFIQFDFDF